MSAEPKPVGVDAALENLVNQFSDPMSFFRELVQNALDAGTYEMEISFEYQEGEGDQNGVMIVHVDDFGEGMDKTIIETRLTRLFSSSKDGDLTKIGRFGIGFVSVFAIHPDAVCIDTTRGGENWRVLFMRDRTFKLIKRDEPVDGTKIQIIKAISREEYEKFTARAREVITYWCKHTISNIVFEGEVINQPLDLDCPVKASYKEEGTNVVVGYPVSEKPFCGFYNKGLTLHEGPVSTADEVSFKIDSRYLEHTLTRDNVLRDDNFQKAMSIVHRLAENELRVRLFDELERSVKSGPAADTNVLYRLAIKLLSKRRELYRKVEDRVWFINIDGEEVTVDRIRRAFGKEKLFFETMKSPLTDALKEQEAVVIKAPPGSDALTLAGWLVDRDEYQEIKRVNKTYCMPEPARSEEEQVKWRPLKDALRRLMNAYGGKISDVTLAHFKYTGSEIGDLVAITQGRMGEITPLSEILTMKTSFFSRNRVFTINADHEMVQRLIEMAPKEPELAAYFLIKLFFLRGELSTALDGELSAHSLMLRNRRLDLHPSEGMAHA